MIKVILNLLMLKVLIVRTERLVISNTWNWWIGIYLHSSDQFYNLAFGCCCPTEHIFKFDLITTIFMHSYEFSVLQKTGLFHLKNKFRVHFAEICHYYPPHDGYYWTAALKRGIMILLIRPTGSTSFLFFSVYVLLCIQELFGKT